MKLTPNRNLVLRIAAIVLSLAFVLPANADIPGYPAGVREIRYQSSGDQTDQPALYWAPATDDAVPLLVTLHTWSSNYRSPEPKYVEWCQQAGWAFVRPNFRGPNNTADALGSDLVVADIVSAVEDVRRRRKIDLNRIYCVGVSGGGHAAMLMAARAPRLWAGVSAWCGISDIALWHQQCQGSKFERYAQHIEAALGGRLKDSADRLADAEHRSPVSWLAKAKTLPPLDLNHGINDGRAGSVPFTHAIAAWNATVADTAQIAANLAKQFYETRQVPAALAESNSTAKDQLYGANQPVFRRRDGNVRLTIFQGGHEIIHNAALNWLAAQVKGKPVNWHPEPR